VEPADKPGSVVSSHSSRPCVAARLEQPTRERRGPRHGSPIRSCSRWGLPCRAALAPRAVRSYRTISPLPDLLAEPSAVCFLLHFPSARAAQALPGTLPCGARTFLGAWCATRLPGQLRRQCNLVGGTVVAGCIALNAPCAVLRFLHHRIRPLGRRLAHRPA